MPSPLNLRLTVEIPYRGLESAPPTASGEVVDGRGNSRNDVDQEGPCVLLVVVKDPHNMSVTELIHLIEGQWKEVWPQKNPLQIRQLINNEFAPATFSPRRSVADIWVDKGRAFREGFDQRGTATVVPVTNSSSSNSQLEQAVSAVPNAEESGHNAERKRVEEACDSTSSRARDQNPIIGPGEKGRLQPATPAQIAKRPRLALGAHVPADNSVEKGPWSLNDPSPVFYTNNRVPAFACPSGHRRNTSSTSRSSYEKGLGLGITASPAYRKRPQTQNVTCEDPQPRPMPLAPSFCDTRKSMPMQPFEQDSPLGHKKPVERPFNSAPSTIAGLRIHEDRPARKEMPIDRQPNSEELAVVIPMQTFSNDWLKPSEVKKLLREPNLSPEARAKLEEMLQLDRDRMDLHDDQRLNSTQRRRELNKVAKRLARRREKFRKMRIFATLPVPNSTQAGDAGDQNECGRRARRKSTDRTNPFSTSATSSGHGASPRAVPSSMSLGSSADPEAMSEPVIPDSADTMVHFKGEDSKTSNPASEQRGEEPLSESDGSYGGDIEYDANVLRDQENSSPTVNGAAKRGKAKKRGSQRLVKSDRDVAASSSDPTPVLRDIKFKKAMLPQLMNKMEAQSCTVDSNAEEVDVSDEQEPSEEYSNGHDGEDHEGREEVSIPDEKDSPYEDSMGHDDEDFEE
ncbi:hypothetical protein POX_b03458 [Penicillium oxalicum]|uniref:hypothetical protein n=1 Tax=Penicillium oxalicum TaxID=69781 RepID=UPI0020B83288|nr:hypothetical protein POX_b03458 [Penicillium oxalicum]KAI2793403.1 hypothetical protein POX_b03458 [Penicillium oxalicum]